jgi:hypothetical protein
VTRPELDTSQPFAEWTGLTIAGADAMHVLATPSDNNHAERPIRPAVIVRKNGYANGSDEDAETQAILMSVFRTLKQRGHNPVSAVLDAIRAYLKTGQLPTLPGRVTENG